MEKMILILNTTKEENKIYEIFNQDKRNLSY